MAFDALKERFKETRIGKKIDKIRTVMSEIKDNQVSLNREYEYKEGDVEKDILFKSETIANDYKKSEQTAKSKKEEAEKKKEEIRQKDYLLTSAKEELKALEAEKEQLRQQIESAKEDEEKKNLEKKLDEEYSDLGINDATIERILEHADEKAEQLRLDDTEQRLEGFDYKQLALQEALDYTSQENPDAYALIALSKLKYEGQQIDRLGVFEGIAQTFDRFDEGQKEEQARIKALPEGSEEQKLLQSQMETDYGYEAKKNSAVQEALKRVQARAAYLSANDPGYEKDTDYVKMAFDEARTKSNEIRDENEKAKIQEAIAEAERQYNEQKGKAKEEAEPKEDPRIAELKAHEQHIITTMAAEQNADMKPHYEKMLAEVREQIAKLTVEQTAASEAEAKRKAEEQAALEKQKKEEQVALEKKKIAMARQEADEAIAKKQKTPEQAVTSTETKDEKNAQQDTDRFSKFLESIRQGKTEITTSDDDYDEDYDEDYNFGLSLFDEQGNLEQTEEAFQYVRTVGDMRKILTSWFFALMGSIQGLDKKAQKKLLPIMQKVKSDIDIAFNTLSPLIKELEGSGEKNAMWAINMSSLVNKLNDALHLAKQHLYGFDEPYKIITGMIRGLHATEFTQLARTFLLEHSEDVLDENGEKTGETRKAFKKMYTTSWGHNGSTNKNGSASDASNCFRAIIRTIKNISNAQTYLDKNASTILKNLTSKCDEILEDKPHKFDVDKVKRTIGDLLQKGNYDEIVRRLSGNDAQDNRAKNAYKISKALELLTKLQKNPSDATTIRDIKETLKKLNDFSDLGIKHEDEDEFSRHIFEDDCEELEPATNKNLPQG